MVTGAPQKWLMRPWMVWYPLPLSRQVHRASDAATIRAAADDVQGARRGRSDRAILRPAAGADSKTREISSNLTKIKIALEHRDDVARLHGRLARSFALDRIGRPPCGRPKHSPATAR